MSSCRYFWYDKDPEAEAEGVEHPWGMIVIVISIKSK